MFSYRSRAGRRSLVATIAMFATAVLGACANETTAPSLATPTPAAAGAAANTELYATSVDLVVERVADDPVDGTVLRLGVTCSGDATFDVIVELEQQMKTVTGEPRVPHASNMVSAYPCDAGHASIDFTMDPDDYKIAFQPGRATAYARIANYQPGVDPAAITTKTRSVAD